ncbi:unnamed protein product [Albugo candida]|nr:unnamed protein product [Albugo candida]|eukprot:CCI48359.1 unnamed protein product [Albugo candida]
MKKQRRTQRPKRPRSASTDHYAEWIYTNEKFVQYYKSQHIAQEAEWDAFMHSLATGLPTTFRINTSCAFIDRFGFKFVKSVITLLGRICQHIEQFNTTQKDLMIDGQPFEDIRTIPWYPDNRAFQWSLERRKLRKLEPLADFQKWLIQLSDGGSITRQEAVSMIPPLLLQVQPEHKVLDMCAAPGSKTSQILESLHAGSSNTIPSGLVVANDCDLKRAYLLVHQSKRLPSPALLVTCGEAQNFPLLSECPSSQGFFDRVLCDVPCSGDGTLRKNPTIWKDWDPKNGLHLHPLQLAIAKRGAQVLKVGGFMCYSTCSFNPIENEAVVTSLLLWSRGALKLVDVSKKLAKLRRRPGLKTWKVLDSDMIEFSSVRNDTESNGKGRKKDKLMETMFPPSSNEVEELGLDKCIRCLPHDENTGGFFICLLEKVAPIQMVDQEIVHIDTPSNLSKQLDDSSDGIAAQDGDAQHVGNQHRRSRLKDNYRPLSDESWEKLRSYYQIDNDLSRKQFLTRSDDAKSITLVSRAITSQLLTALKRNKISIVFAGLRAFELSSVIEGAKYLRLTQASVSSILPFIQARKLEVCPADFQKLLDQHGKLLPFSDFADGLQQQFESSSIGSIVCSTFIDISRDGDGQQKMLHLVVWRGRSTINIMACKADVATLMNCMKALGLYQATSDEKEQSENLGSINDSKTCGESAPIAPVQSPADKE